MTPEEVMRVEALKAADSRGLLSQRQSLAVQELTRRMGNGMPSTGGQMGRKQRYEREPWTLGKGLRVANLSTLGIPVVNDIAGFLDDSYMYLTDPESRTWGNAAMSAAGLLPFVPSAGGIIAGRGAQTLKPETVEMAEKMRDAGASRDEIWRATGEATGQPAFFDERGQLKFEIDDSQMRFDVPLEGNTKQVEDAKYLRDKLFSYSDEEIEFFKELEGFGGTNAEYIAKEYSRLDDEAANIYGSTYRLGDSYKNPDVISAYPDLAGIETRFTSSKSADLFGQGAYRPDTDSMSLVGDSRARSVGSHELQHAIQGREDFAMGGSPNDFMLDNQAAYEMAGAEIGTINEKLGRIARNLDDLRGRLPDLDSDTATKVKEFIAKQEAEYSGLMDRKLAMVERVNTDPRQKSFSQYQRLGGEAEARAVQARLDMPMQDRIKKPFWESYDVPEDEFIYRYE